MGGDSQHPKPCNHAKIDDERGRKATKLGSPFTPNTRLGGRERAFACKHLNISEAIRETLNTFNSPLPKISKSPRNLD